MNFNEFTYLHKAKNKFRRNNRVVNVQRPLIGQNYRANTRKTSTKATSGISSIKWKNKSSSNNVTSTVTRSSTSRTYTSDYASRIVIAVSAGRGEANCEIGLAVMDICKPTLILCQISDTPSYINTLTKINIFNPDEILIPLTFVECPNSNRLTDKIKEHFKNTTITAVSRMTYNKTKGMEYVKELCSSQWDSILLILQHKFYCLTAASALLTYAESVLYMIYNRQSLKVEYQESEGYTIIDVATADKLELVASNSTTSNEKYSSLLRILDYCFTKIGARTLRATILQPPCSVPDIEARLDCIAEIKANPDMMTTVQTILPKLSNIDQLLSLATISTEHREIPTERHLTYVLALNSLLSLIEPLREALEYSEQPFFKELQMTLNDESFIKLSKLTRSLIQPNAHPATGQQGILQKCFVIKPGANGLLDLLRKIYSERVEDLKEYVKQLAEKYNLPLSLSNSNKKGYHIVLQLTTHSKRTFKKSDLPEEFFQVERLVSSVTMKTPELMSLSVRISDILFEVLRMTNMMIHGLLVEVRNHIGLFYTLCEHIAKLDMIQSLAQASSGIGYCRPEFKEFLEVTNSRHPLLDFLCSTGPTPNSIFASRDHNVHILTGPNGAGKSIFIRQVLLLQVMAQVGCFIPAEKAVFRVCDRVLARVYFEDNMDCGASTFVLEVKEIQYFHSVVTSNTLIIIDELCRSTAVVEGTALAMAMVESLSKSQAFIFLATHYILVTKLEKFYPNVTNWQMETIEETKERNILRFTYSLEPGITTLRKYGLNAAIASWPANIFKEASVLYEQIEPPKERAKIQPQRVADNLKYNFESELRLLKQKSELTLAALRDCILQYAINLKAVGVDISQFLPQEEIEAYIGKLPETSNSKPVNYFTDQNNSYQNITENESIGDRIDVKYLCPQVVYSPNSSNAEVGINNEQLFDYRQFCDEIEIKSVVVSDNQSVFENNLSTQNNLQRDSALSLIFSQNLTKFVNQKQNSDIDASVEASQQNQHDSKDYHYSNNSIPWKSEVSNTSTQNSLKYAEFNNMQSSTPNTYITRKTNILEDPDISAAIEELKECSSYFDEEPDWNCFSEDVDKTFKNTMDESHENRLDESTKPNVIIQSVHIFNQDNQLISVQEFQPPGKKYIENSEIAENQGNGSILEDDQVEYECNKNLSRQHPLPIFADISSVGNETLTQNISVKRETRKSFATKFFEIQRAKCTFEDFANNTQTSNEVEVLEGNTEEFKKPMSKIKGKSFDSNFENEQQDVSFRDQIGEDAPSTSKNYQNFVQDKYLSREDVQKPSISFYTLPNIELRKMEKEETNLMFSENDNKNSKKDIQFSNNDNANYSCNSIKSNQKQFLNISHNNTQEIFPILQFGNDKLNIIQTKTSTILKENQNVLNLSKDANEDADNTSTIAPSSIDEYEKSEGDIKYKEFKMLEHNSNKNIINASFTLVKNEKQSTTTHIGSQNVVGESQESQKHNNHSVKEIVKPIEEKLSRVTNSPDFILESPTEYLNDSRRIDSNESTVILDSSYSTNVRHIDEIRSKKRVKSEISKFGQKEASQISKGLQIEKNEVNKNRIKNSLSQAFTKQSGRVYENMKTKQSSNLKNKQLTSASPSAAFFNILGQNMTQRLTDVRGIMNNGDIEDTDIDEDTKSFKSFIERKNRKNPTNLIKLENENIISSNKITKLNNFNKTPPPNLELNVNTETHSCQFNAHSNIGKTIRYREPSNNSEQMSQDIFLSRELDDSHALEIKEYQHGTEKIYNPCDSNTINHKESNNVAKNVLEANSNSINSLIGESVKHQSYELSDLNRNYAESDAIDCPKVNLHNNSKSTSLIKSRKHCDPYKITKDEAGMKDALKDDTVQSTELLEIIENEAMPSCSTRISKNGRFNKNKTSKSGKLLEVFENEAGGNKCDVKSNSQFNVNDSFKSSATFEVVEDENESSKITKRNQAKQENKDFEKPLSSYNIFETSESVFSSSPEAFFSAVDTTPKNKITSGDDSEVIVTKKQSFKRKFKTPLKNTDAKKMKQSLKIPTKKTIVKTKFVPPKMLTKKEILEDYEKQSRKFLENTDDPDNMEKYINFITNRPNVNQLRAQKCVAVVKRTNDGSVVIRASNPEVKRKKVVPLKRKLSSTEFDKTLFSDKNSDKLQGLLKTEQNIFSCDEEKCGNIFNFGDDNNKKLFDFRSNKSSQSQQIDITLKTPATSNFSQSSSKSFTPEGYYKTNKNLIENIIKKYS